MTPFTAEVHSILGAEPPALPEGAVHVHRTPLGARLTPATWPVGAYAFTPARPAPTRAARRRRAPADTRRALARAA